MQILRKLTLEEQQTGIVMYDDVNRNAQYSSPERGSAEDLRWKRNFEKYGVLAESGNTIGDDLTSQMHKFANRVRVNVRVC